jgi:hypothetical protein
MHARAQSKPEKITSWLFKSIGSWRTLLGGLIAVGLTIVSIKFNLELAKSMSVDNDSKQLLMAGFGMLDLACVFLAGFIGIRSRSPFRKAVAWVLFAYLLALSLWASVAYALAIDARKASTANSHAIELKLSELETQQRNVELWQANLTNTEQYKTRYSGLLAKEQSKLRVIQSELSELETKLPSPTMAIYERVGPHVGMSSDNLALLVRILWSVALVLAPIVLLPLLGAELYGHEAVHDDSPTPPKGTKKRSFTGWFHSFMTSRNVPSHVPNEVQPSLSPVASNAPNEVQPKKRTRTPQSRAPQGLQHDTGTQGKAGNRYAELKKSVLSGRTRPSVRGVRDYCGCNQEVANRYIDSLASEGVIERSGNGWKLRQLRVVGGQANA